MSDELKAFYRAYLAWLEAGAPEGMPFLRGLGLCSSVPDVVTRAYSYDVRQEMKRQFREAGLNSTLPFNSHPGATEDLPNYGDECNSGACHLNPKRIAWVREHAQ